MATYSTDLTTYTTAESGTWTEYGSANSGGTPAADGENFIQGTDCRSQTTGTKSGTGNPKSVVFNNGSDPSGSWTTDDVFLVWQYYAVGANLYDFDQTTYSGSEIGIANDTTNVDRFFVGGADTGRNPYGGWANFAIDPTATASTTYGTGGAGYQYVGSIVYTINAISKGTPHAVDAIRYGRGEISVTGTGGTFAELASYNDYNAGSTPPGTSSTSVDSGRHRLGLFQESGGTYLWKGMMALGLTGTSVTFTDSNETIILDDCIHTYAAFNKIEVRNASSSVTLTNCTFISTATVTAYGQFEAVADATITLTSCSFNNMDTFIFDANTTASGCTFNTCNTVTANEADLGGSSFLTPRVAADGAAVSWAETIAAAHTITELDGCTFSMGANNHHAISFSTGVSNGANVTLRDLVLNGFDADGTGDSDNSMFEFLATTGTITLTLEGCTVDGSAASASNVTVDTRAGCTVNVVTGAVTVKVTTTDSAGDPIQSARVQLRASNGTGPFPYADAVTITRSTTTATVTHTAHGMASNDKVMLRGITGNKTADNTVHQITVTTVNAYTFTTADSGDTTYTGDGFLIDAQDETNYTASFSGGTGHTVSDVITLRGGAKVTVDAVSGGVVTQFTVASGEDDGGNSASDVQDQVSSTGTGIDFSLTLAAGNIVTEIRSTFVALNGTTDGSGVISTTRVYGSNQPVIGWARKMSASPYFKEGPINATVNSSTGLDATAVMVSDE